MRIEQVEVLNLCYEYPVGDRFAFAGGTCTGRVSSLVLVKTDSGLTGIGSCYTHPGLAALTVATQFDPMLRGRDPADVEGIWDEMYRLTRWFGRKGAVMSVLGGLDVALWDLRGKTLGKPVWQLLGAEAGRVPAYASALLWKDDIAALAAEAAALTSKGFTRVKMRLGRNEDYDTSAVLAVRAAVGPDRDVIVDSSMRYTVEQAMRMEPVLREAGVFWWEEPFQPEDLQSYAALRMKTEIPLAAGENEFGLQGFQELIERRAIDIVQPDVSRSGGITEVRRIGAAADAAGLRVATHTWSDSVAVIANAHALASMPNRITVELDRTNNSLIDGLLLEPLRVTNGMLELGTRPGLGIELDEVSISRLGMSDSERPPDGNYSDMAFGQGTIVPAPPWRPFDPDSIERRGPKSRRGFSRVTVGREVLVCPGDPGVTANSRGGGL
jgi:L-alanine-DL-glutamate epimerase-like enolase superfamily enzyme